MHSAVVRDYNEETTVAVVRGKEGVAAAAVTNLVMVATGGGCRWRGVLGGEWLPRERYPVSQDYYVDFT